jgi:glycine cleavage system H protein
MTTYYTKEHEWVKVKDGKGSVGITEYAAHQLGDVTFVELPAVGKSVKQFDAVAAIESVKAASDIYSPVSGTVTQVNELLNDRPELVNESAEDAAWIAMLDIADEAEFEKLMDRAAYEEYVRGLE